MTKRCEINGCKKVARSYQDGKRVCRKHKEFRVYKKKSRRRKELDFA